MKNGTNVRKVLAAAALCMLWGNPGFAVQGEEKPVQEGDIVYITGGIGEEERQMLEAMRSDYNLHVMSASNSGAFVGATELEIHDRKGNLVLSTEAGPLFYANLPPGTYTLRVRNSGQEKKQTVTVGKNRSSNIHFGWNL